MEQFNGTIHEFKALFNNTLASERADELRDKMLAAGTPAFTITRMANKVAPKPKPAVGK